jgi:RNase P subunit RPR2
MSSEKLQLVQDLKYGDKTLFKDVSNTVPFNSDGIARYSMLFDITKNNFKKDNIDRSLTERKMHTLMDMRLFLNIDPKTKPNVIQRQCHDCLVMIKNNVEHHAKKKPCTSIFMCLECTIFYHPGGGMYTVCKKCYSYGDILSSCVHEDYYQVKRNALKTSHKRDGDALESNVSKALKVVEAKDDEEEKDGQVEDEVEDDEEEMDEDHEEDEEADDKNDADDVEEEEVEEEEEEEEEKEEEEKEEKEEEEKDEEEIDLDKKGVVKEKDIISKSGIK